MANFRQGNKEQPRTVAVLTTPTLLSGDGRFVNRIFRNEGTSSVRLGLVNVTYNGTAATDGLLLASGERLEDENSQNEWYAICAAATTATVSVLEIKG